eukprot:g60797.t1
MAFLAFPLLVRQRFFWISPFHKFVLSSRQFCMPPKRKGSSTKEASQESEPKRQKSKGKSPKAAKSTEEKDAALAEVRATLLRRVSSSRRPQPSQAFKVISWNVNGLRAVLAKAGKLKSLVESEDPCVLCLQEIK